MDFLLGALIVAAVVAAAVAAMLAVRRRAPEGSYFSDGDRASGVFGGLAPGFPLLLGRLQEGARGGAPGLGPAVRDGPVPAARRPRAARRGADLLWAVGRRPGV